MSRFARDFPGTADAAQQAAAAAYQVVQATRSLSAPGCAAVRGRPWIRWSAAVPRIHRRGEVHDRLGKAPRSRRIPGSAPATTWPRYDLARVQPDGVDRLVRLRGRGFHSAESSMRAGVPCRVVDGWRVVPAAGRAAR